MLLKETTSKLFRPSATTKVTWGEYPCEGLLSTMLKEFAGLTAELKVLPLMTFGTLAVTGIGLSVPELDVLYVIYAVTELRFEVAFMVTDSPGPRVVGGAVFQPAEEYVFSGSRVKVSPVMF
jgi:hypothetical protein